MKKLVKIFISILFFSALASNVEASTTFNAGYVNTTTSVYSKPNASSSNRMYDDEFYYISVYSPNIVEIIGEEGSFYNIKFMRDGFIYKGYALKSNIDSVIYVTDDEYENSLISKGFPADYANKLAILHAIHPNWIFTPSNTLGISGGADFNSVVTAETNNAATNVINSTNESLRSTADGAYSNGVWYSLAGDGWYGASKQTVAFYLDPRNFLDEEHIFMFENLGYNAETQTLEVVNRILGSSFMSNPFNCGEGLYLCSVGEHGYADVFINTGIDKKVSPVHLATRALQEQGQTGSVLSLGVGYKGDYVGYYNFFNIAASGSSDDEVIISGLEYAKNRNWNNQYASIYEGSSFIANSYISVGQSTLYYQKFNTINGAYWHQYQQNVRAPYQEGSSTFYGYYPTYSSREEWNNAIYEFLIPIYSNMPAATTLDTKNNSDATLKTLTISSCKLNPGFISSATNYECYVPKSTESVTLDYAATNALAKVSGDKSVTLSEDETTIKIVVTAADGTESTYSIIVKKIDTDGYSPSEVLNGIGLKVNGSVLSNIEVGADVSNIINSISSKYHFAEIKVTDEKDNEIKDGTIKTGYHVTVVNAGITSMFNTVIYGDTSGDGLIDIRDLLVVQKHLVKSKTLDGAYLTSSDINKDGNVDIRDLLLLQKYILKQYTINQG